MTTVGNTINQRYQAERELLARDFRLEYQAMMGMGDNNANNNANTRVRGGGSNPLNPLASGEDDAIKRTGRRRLGGVSDHHGSANAPYATAAPAAQERIGAESSKYGLFSKKTSADYGQRELSLMQKMDGRPHVSFKQSAASPHAAAATAVPAMPVRAGPPRDALDIFSDEMSDKLKPQQGKRRQPWQQQGTAGRSPWGEW